MTRSLAHSTVPVKDKLGGDHLFKISRFKQKIKKTQPHRHGPYFELIYLQEGEGFHQIESERYKISPPEMYFLHPGSLHCWQFTSIPKGFVLLIDEAYYDIVRHMPALQDYENSMQPFRLQLPADYRPTALFEAMLAEYQLNGPYSQEVIRGLLQAVIAKMMQLSNTISSNHAPASSLYRSFIRLLVQQTPKWSLVREFATALHTTPQNLTRVCQQQCGQSAGSLINHHLLMEAKRLLLHTDMSMTEIAYQLQFSDASHFGKFFKKHTQYTPAGFREYYFNHTKD